jgi:hypothetical protein
MRRGQSDRHVFGFFTLMLLGTLLLLSGVAAYWRCLALVGYLLTVAAWWAIARPPLTTRVVNWRRRHH